MDSWWWKLAVLAAIFAVREAVRWAGTASQTPQKSATRAWIEVLDSAMIAFAFVFLVALPFVLQAFYIPSGSMEETLRYRPTYDRLLVSKWIYRVREPQRGDVVVFHPPELARVPVGEDYIKRCIGVPGDVIEIRSRQLWRNGQKVREPYVKWSEETPLAAYDLKVIDGVVYSREYSQDGTADFWRREGRVGSDENNVPYQEESNQGWIEGTASQPIPEGSFLVLGDHRNASSDGRVWGLIPRENIVGKAMCVFWPPRRIGTLDRMSQESHSATSNTRGAQKNVRNSRTKISKASNSQMSHLQKSHSQKSY